MIQNACKGCIYHGRAGRESICEYILMEHRRRPCPPGEGCTVKIVGGTDMKQKAWDETRARQLYEEGKNDIDIADMVGASVGVPAEKLEYITGEEYDRETEEDEEGVEW